MHREHEVPEEVAGGGDPRGARPRRTVWLPRLLAETGLAGSNAEARRLIEQGGVRLDGEAVLDDPDVELAGRDPCVAESCRSAGAGSSACADGGGVRTPLLPWMQLNSGACS